MDLADEMFGKELKQGRLFANSYGQLVQNNWSVESYGKCG